MPERKEVQARLASPGGWGKFGRGDMPRHSTPLPSRSRRRCPVCWNRATHTGMANGVAMIDGCEFHVAQWVRSSEPRVSSGVSGSGYRKTTQ